MNKTLFILAASAVLLASCTQNAQQNAGVPSAPATLPSVPAVSDAVKVDTTTIASGTVNVQGENGTQVTVSQGNVQANGVNVQSGSVQMNGASVKDGSVQLNGTSIQAVSPTEQKEIDDAINSAMGDDADGVNMEKIK